jgi:hypothetical protein
MQGKPEDLFDLVLMDLSERKGGEEDDRSIG